MDELAATIHTKRGTLKVEAIKAGSCIVDLVCEVHSPTGDVEALGDAEVCNLAVLYQNSILRGLNRLFVDRWSNSPSFGPASSAETSSSRSFGCFR